VRASETDGSDPRVPVGQQAADQGVDTHRHDLT
jgi:hypothetical protein